MLCRLDERGRKRRKRNRIEKEKEREGLEKRTGGMIEKASLNLQGASHVTMYK